VVFALRQAPLGFNFPISQSADPAGAEACRYSGKSHFIFAPSEPFCGYSFL
jgi:hypothetical protein